MYLHTHTLTSYVHYIASLIELLAEVLDAEQSLFGKKVRPVEDWLKRYLRSGFVLRYERRKEIAADETIQSRTAHPFVLTPTLVSQRGSALELNVPSQARGAEIQSGN